MRIENFKVNGMSCEHCVKTITNSLLSVAGVEKAEVSLSEKNVSVFFDETKADLETLKARIVEEGYEIA